jgi:hypothetical protein
MATLSKDKLLQLKNAFVEEAMLPGEAAAKVGTTYATAKRYYDKWAEEIAAGLERRLLPDLEASVKLRRKAGSQTRRAKRSS